MKRFQRLLTSLVIVGLVAASVVTACGDEELAEESDDGTNTDNQSSVETKDDCDDVQYWHPIEEECRTGGGGVNSEECDEDERFDAAAGECVPRCAADEIWDETEGGCVPFDECREEDGQEGCGAIDECGPGDIIGRSCRTDGEVLAGVEVTVEGVDCEGEVFSETTTADEDGVYDLYEIPTGLHHLSVSSGSWSQAFDVAVLKGETTDLTWESGNTCLKPGDTRVAVVGGAWDDIGQLLEELGVDYDFFSTGYGSGGEIDDLVSELDSMLKYDIIFVESGAGWSSTFDTDLQLVENNIRRFINEGRSLYASNFADDWIRKSFPEIVEFNDDHSGSSDQTVTADVLSSQMEALLGSTTAEVYFESAGWSIVDDGGPASVVHFEADVDSYGETIEDAALMVQYNDPVDGGRVVFTSFHNNSQSTNDMEDILKFMIFQL